LHHGGEVFGEGGDEKGDGDPGRGRVVNENPWGGCPGQAQPGSWERRALLVLEGMSEGAGKEDRKPDS